jgi:hypothetical protein
MITRDTNIEELVWAYQGFVGFLEDLALQKGWDDDRIDKLVDRLNAHFR